MSSTAQPTQAKARLPWAYWSLVLTYLAVAMNVTVASIALPTISVDLQATSTELAWILNATPMASAALVLFMGALGDRMGRRRLLRIGLIVFLVSATLSAIARDPVQLIALRALTGVGSALVMPAALALVFDVVPKQSQRTAVGIVGATQAIGSLIGPILAGVALLFLPWGAAFAVVIPLLILAMIGTMRLPATDEGSAQEKEPLDVAGATLVGIASVTLLYAAVTASTSADKAGSATSAWISLAIGIASVVALIWWERRCPYPLFVGSIMRKKSFWLATTVIFVVQMALGGILFANTQYVQLVLGFSAFAAAAFLVPALLAWVLSSATAGITAKRFGLRTMVSVSLVFAAAGLLLIGSQGQTPVIVVLLLGLFLAGLMGVAPSLMTHLAVSSYPESRRTTGSAINSAASRYGLSLGVAAFGSVMGTVFSRQMAPQVAGLSAQQAEVASGSLGGALSVAKELPADIAEAFSSAARSAFTSGFSLTLNVAAALLLLLAVVVFVAMGNTKTPVTAEPIGEPDV